MIHSKPGSAASASTLSPNPPAGRSGDRQGLAIMLTCLVSLIFAVQDAVSRHLGVAYSPIFVTMVRYWFFGIFVIAMAARGPGGLRAASRSHHPLLQITRGLLLVFEIVIMIVSFVKLGLIGTHAVFAAYPLLVVALSGPVLGERIGWRPEDSAEAFRAKVEGKVSGDPTVERYQGGDYTAGRRSPRPASPRSLSAARGSRWSGWRRRRPPCRRRTPARPPRRSGRRGC